jgi:hypothetical protein
MSTSSLHLVSITCDNRDDTLNRDKPYLKINGATIWSGQGFAKGTSLPLSTVPPQPFANAAELELWESDAAPNADDFIGRHTVRANEAGTGPKTATFNQSGALYRVVYRVA